MPESSKPVRAPETDGAGLLQLARTNTDVACLIDRLIIDPAVTVARNFPIRSPHRGDRFRIAFKRHCYTKHRDRKVAFAEQAMQTPEPCPRAILIQGFHVHVSLVYERFRTDHLGQKRFGRRVAVQDAIFGAFLVIDHKLHGDARTIGPARIGNPASVACPTFKTRLQMP